MCAEADPVLEWLLEPEEPSIHLESKRRPDSRWELDHTKENLVVEPRHPPSKMITFLALRALRRAGRITRRGSP